METLNPAEVFGNIMVEYPYVECTDSSVLGLTYFHKYFDYRKEEIRTRIRIAIEFIKNLNYQMEVGMEAGVFVLHMPVCLHWRHYTPWGDL